MTMTKNTHTPIAILKLPHGVQPLITYARAIVTAMTANPHFPTPTPALAAVTTATDDLQLAETAALTRAKGTIAVRNEKRAALVTLLRQLKGYVQTVVDANAETGTSIIESAAIAVKKTAARKPRVFGAEPGVVSGSAKLVAPSAGGRAFYEWQYSLDGGKTWVAAPGSMQAKTTVAGLTPGASVQFRYRPATKSGEGDWSQPVTLIVK
jgi:hypothetical protein